jgi:hypothetical protein
MRSRFSHLRTQTKTAVLLLSKTSLDYAGSRPEGEVIPGSGFEIGGEIGVPEIESFTVARDSRLTAFCDRRRRNGRTIDAVSDASERLKKPNALLARRSVR